jgi:hypothetical protein
VHTLGVPKMLMDDHKTKRMGSTLKFLTRYAQEGDEFLDLFLHLKKHVAGKNFDDDNEMKEEVITWFKGQAALFYDSVIQKLVPRFNVWTVPATLMKNKVMYRQFIYSVAFVNYKCFTCLSPLYLYFPDTFRTLQWSFGSHKRHSISLLPG